MSRIDYRVGACHLFGGSLGAKSSSSPARKEIGVDAGVDAGCFSDMACLANPL